MNRSLEVSARRCAIARGGDFFSDRFYSDEDGTGTSEAHGPNALSHVVSLGRGSSATSLRCGDSGREHHREVMSAAVACTHPDRLEFSDEKYVCRRLVRVRSFESKQRHAVRSIERSGLTSPSHSLEKNELGGGITAVPLLIPERVPKCCSCSCTSAGQWTLESDYRPDPDARVIARAGHRARRSEQSLRVATRSADETLGDSTASVTSRLRSAPRAEL